MFPFSKDNDAMLCAYVKTKDMWDCVLPITAKSYVVHFLVKSMFLLVCSSETRADVFFKWNTFVLSTSNIKTSHRTRVSLLQEICGKTNTGA